MADTREAIENVRSLARTFQSVIDLAAALDGMTSLEQATSEARVQLAKAQKERDEVHAEVHAANDALASIRNLAAAEREAMGKLQEDARQQARDMVAAAKREAEQLVDAARLTCKAREDNSNVALAALEDRRKDLEGQVKTLEARLTKVREQAQKLLG